ncbi:SusD/RagB family nutrient-binding outer membrane lipoprotein [Fulvivirgaceae bacterium BMA10]|uniref:SusD/RagB family nutrient-binding outer membrane lipoprotein n=1 Tax=Splendidivirga corallicola TaxID=3051826 RepID=A0ABT8KLN5_9BACT|nr:SusD/RagB family nutrient-binding outer membrane lipoprotein [Fulvivirgaceae bacterium BMA10]
MKNIIKSLFLITLMLFASCESIVDGINDNPNELTPTDVNAEFFLNGAMLANSVAQAGHLNRISGLWSGQLFGFTSLYSNIYGYSMSSAESVTTWSRIYIGVIPNVRNIRSIVPDDKLLVGISKVLEAHAVGTAASLFGNVPYSEINTEVEDPKFDGQMAVFNSLISLLNDAISDLNGASSRTVDFDIYFGGDATKWLAAANTLKARYHLQMKDYGAAYTAAQNGISSADGSMKYIPRGDPSISEGDKNLFWTILEGSRAGDIGTGNSYMMQLLDPASGINRNNAKTDETARFGYYTIDENSGNANLGIIEQFEPHNLITYQENLLILAETGARTADFNTGLGHLNELRQYLNTGDFLNENFVGQSFQYDDYVEADFMAGGIENGDNIDQTRALLREIIEERYISGFGMFMGFNDARRLRKNDSDIAVPFPLNNAAASQHPERMPYSEDELNSNSNAPEVDPGILEKTEVNK